jgi:AcrR family transcriptional regulator
MVAKFLHGVQDGSMAEGALAEPGRREQKRQETLARIKDKGLHLFLTKGYAETTLDEIAEASGIARRTFFSYFASKDEILFAVQDNGFSEALLPTLRAQPAKLGALAATRATLIELIRKHQRKEALAVDACLYSTQELRARKAERYAQMEQVMFEVLCERRPNPKERVRLRLVAMASVGAFRVAMEAWRADQGKSPLWKHIDETFAALKDAL